MINLSTILASSQKGFLKNVIEGAGLTLLSSGGILLSYHAFVDRFMTMANGMPNQVAQLLGLSGFDVFISLILGAISTKYAQNSAKVFLGKKK